MISNECPTHNEIEDLNHIVQCGAMLNVKQKFIGILKEKLIKEIKTNQSREVINIIINDMKKCLQVKDGIECA